MTKRYRSPVMASIHETAEGLHAAGVMDEQTMRKFDDARLTPVHPLTPKKSARCRNAKARARPCSPATSTSRPASSANGSAARSVRRARPSSSYRSSPSMGSGPGASGGRPKHWRRPQSGSMSYHFKRDGARSNTVS
jgi:hypothetical protein